MRACSDYTHIIDDQAAVTSAQFRVVDHVANYTDSPTPRGCSAFALSRSHSLLPVFPLKIIESRDHLFLFFNSNWDIYCYIKYIIRHGRDISKIDLSEQGSVLILPLTNDFTISCNIFATDYTILHIYDDRIMYGKQFHKRYNSPVTSVGEWIRAMYY